MKLFALIFMLNVFTFTSHAVEFNPNEYKFAKNAHRKFESLRSLADMFINTTLLPKDGDFADRIIKGKKYCFTDLAKKFSMFYSFQGTVQVSEKNIIGAEKSGTTEFRFTLKYENYLAYGWMMVSYEYTEPVGNMGPGEIKCRLTKRAGKAYSLVTRANNNDYEVLQAVGAH